MRTFWDDDGTGMGRLVRRDALLRYIRGRVLARQGASDAGTMLESRVHVVGNVRTGNLQTMLR